MSFCPSASIIFIGWTAKKFRLADCQSVSIEYLLYYIMSVFKRFNLFSIACPILCQGLDWVVGGRCFLEILVLRHSASDNVFMETICKQPKASTTLSQTWPKVNIFILLSVFYFSHNFIASRYAFTPLIDDSDDEEIEEFIASSNIGTVNIMEELLLIRTLKTCVSTLWYIYLCFIFFFFFIHSRWHKTENL